MRRDEFSAKQRAMRSVQTRVQRHSEKLVRQLASRLGFVGTLDELKMLAFRNITPSNPAWERLYHALSQLIHEHREWSEQEAPYDTPTTNPYPYEAEGEADAGSHRE